jgi:hypothetical protein
MPRAEPEELARFIRGEVDARSFPHREHVRMAFEMLRHYDFAQSAHLYSQALRAMTTRVGQPEIFNQTLTIAFLALVAERMQASGADDFPALELAHPELFDRSLLSRWYPPERLASEAARRTFLLPEPCG